MQRFGFIGMICACAFACGSDEVTEVHEGDQSQVLATIDGTPIRIADLEDRINSQSLYIRSRYKSVEMKREFLDSLIQFEVLAKEAKTAGFDKDPEVVRTVKKLMIQKLMQDKLQNSISPEEIPESEMRAAYQASRDEFHRPERVRIAAIVLDSAAVAKSVAKAAHGTKGTSHQGFRDLVFQYSVDEASKDRGGDLGYFSATDAEPPQAVRDAAFALPKTGAVAGPITVADGRIFVIKRTGHTKALDKSFEEVKRQIQNRLYREKRAERQSEYVRRLKAEAKIEIFSDALNKVHIDEAAHDHSGEASGTPHEHSHETHRH